MQKTYDAAKTEREMQEFWEREQIYRFVPDGREVYSIDTPPPTVSGSLHIGHIFSYTQAEIVARFRRMQGYNVFYPFGFDDNGLPTERLVEKEHGVRAADLPRGEFTALCRKTASRYVEEFKNLWRRLGFSADWELSYETIGERAQRLSQLSFLELAKTGKAYRKESPVLWCPECRTSIAQAELDTAERESAYHFLPFRIGGETVEVATTRPELLYGCVALFVHPRDGRYARHIGKTAVVPLYGFEIPVMGDPGVQPEKGTGAVMCATFGDAADLAWFEKYHLPYKRVLGPDGRLSAEVPGLAGMTAAQARRAIAEILREKGLLLRTERISHAVAVHERCGHDVEILPSRQWYIDILSGKERLLAAADEIRWHPSSMKTRYTLWVQNLKWDWCVSRQRYFGVPIPVWYCKACGRPLFPDEMGLPVNPLEDAPSSPCVCGCREYEPETAVLDTWATSSLTPFLNAERGGGMPMSMRAQAHEIIRTWAFYSIARGVLKTGHPPFKDMMICGFVMAKKGEKISKSKGNAADSPAELIEAYSADALRYWAAGARLGTDTVFSHDELRVAQRFLTKLWNASRFAAGFLEGGRPRPPKALSPVDAWFLARCAQAQLEEEKLLTRYDTGAARTLLDDLFWKDFCDNYLELVKDRLYHPEEYGEDGAASARCALYTGFLAILKLYAPVVPHITEAVYREVFLRSEGAGSIHLTRWERPAAPDPELLRNGDALKETLALMRRFKTERGLSLRAELAGATLFVPAESAAFFKSAAPDLKACCRVREIFIEKSDTAGAEFTV